MELHSYAKRRSKKWTNEQKRKLVETRITHDALFSSMPPNSLVPWRKLIIIAKLEEYNCSFLRKQWSIMLSKYKQYKQNRLGNIPSKAINEEMVQKLTKEWEFFLPLHRFMIGKNTNLHSYALTSGGNTTQNGKVTKLKEVTQQHPPSASSTERINTYSSDTNEDFAAKNVAMILKKENSPILTRQVCYLADASEDTLESMVYETAVFELPVNVQEEEEIVTTKVDDDHDVPTTEMATEAGPSTAAVIAQNGQIPLVKEEKEKKTIKKSLTTPKLNERDKYYRHKRRYNRRQERRFDALLNVFGQIVKAEYPSIDVGPIMGAAAAGTNIVRNLFASDNELSWEEGDSEDDETASYVDVDKNTTTTMNGNMH